MMNFTHPAALPPPTPPGKKPRYLLSWSLGCPQTLYGRVGEKIFCCCRDLNPRFSSVWVSHCTDYAIPAPKLYNVAEKIAFLWYFNVLVLHIRMNNRWYPTRLSSVCQLQHSFPHYQIVSRNRDRNVEWHVAPLHFPSNNLLFHVCFSWLTNEALRLEQCSRTLWFLYLVDCN
jgi:hypothetical protein